jgi:hypothetical protein
MLNSKSEKYLKSPVIFIGFGRSGTSIISEIIFQHPDLAWVPNYQAIFPSTNKINLLRNIFDNRFWQIKGQKKELNKVPLFNKFIFRPGEVYSYWSKLTGRDFGREFFFNVRETEENVKKLRTFFAGLVKYQNRKRLSFKITGPPKLEYLNSVFPDAKFVWIKREPLPNIRSLLNVYFYQDRKHQLWWRGKGVYTEEELKKAKDWKDEPALTAALQYFKVHEIFELEKSKLGLKNSVLEISYKDFVVDSRSQIMRMLDFLELESAPEIDHFLKENRIFNRNKKERFYISSELDGQVLHIARNGVK